MNNNLIRNEHNTNSLKNINKQNVDFAVNVRPSLDGLKNIDNTVVDKPFLNSKMTQSENLNQLNDLSEYEPRPSVNQIQNQINDLKPGIFRANNVKNIINKNISNNNSNNKNNDVKNNKNQNKSLNDTINEGINYLNNAIVNAKNKLIKPKEPPIMNIEIEQKIKVNNTNSNGSETNNNDNGTNNNNNDSNNTNNEKEENNLRRSINDIFVKGRLSKLFIVLVLIIAGFLIYHLIIKKKTPKTKKSVYGKKKNNLLTKVAMNNSKNKFNNTKLKTGKSNNIVLETI